MRKLFTLLAALGLVTSVAAPVSAAVVPFTGTIEVTVGPLPALPVPGSGTMTITNSEGDLKPVIDLRVPANAFSTTLTLPLPNVFPIVQLKIQAQNNAGTFNAAAPACGTAHPMVTCAGTAPLHGRSGLGGAAFVGIFGTAGSPGANLTIPLAVAGAGSMFNATSSLGITVMLSGAGWTTGTASVTTANGTVTQMGGQNIGVTAMQGNIVLVSPLQVYNNATSAFLPSFVRWTLNYAKEPVVVPEPGMLLLLGSGVVGLSLYGRSRMRK